MIQLSKTNIRHLDFLISKMGCKPAPKRFVKGHKKIEISYFGVWDRVQTMGSRNVVDPLSCIFPFKD